MSGKYVHLAVSDGDLYNENRSLKIVPRPRSALSPTPRSRDHTQSSVRFSETAESISYTDTFVDLQTTPSHSVETLGGRSTYTESFDSESTTDIVNRSHSSLQSLDNADSNPSYSDTFEITASSSKQPDFSSVYSSQFEVDSPNTVKSVNTTEKAFQTDDSISYLRSKYDYTDSFETTEFNDSQVEDSQSEAISVDTDYDKQMFIEKLMRQLQCEKAVEENSVTTAINKDSEKSEDLETLNYCRRKIKLLKKKKKPGFDPGVKLAEEKISVTEYGFHPSIIERLKTKSFMAAMERATKIDIHDPRECEECRQVKCDLDQREMEKFFVRGKVVHLQRKTMEDKISKHLAEMDSISLIGNIMRDLPKATDNKMKINNQLIKPLSDDRSDVRKTEII